MANGRITVTPDNFSLPSGVVGSEQLKQSEALDADRLQHLYKPDTNFALPVGGTPVTREEIVFVASTAGTIRAFHALLAITGTATDVDFDLEINGVSALSAAVNIVHGDANGEVKDGTLSTVALAAGDLVTIAMTVTSATGAQGPYAWVEIEETAA